MVISSFGKTTTDVVVCVMVWLIHSFFMLIIANFHTKKYHKKIQELLFYWYITEALSGRRPWIEIQHLVNPKKTSAWNMKKRVKNGLNLKIQTESEAIVAAKELFQNVAKPGSEFIKPVDFGSISPGILCLGDFDLLRGDIRGCYNPHQLLVSGRSDGVCFQAREVSCLVNLRLDEFGFMMVVKKINFLSTALVGLDKKEYQFSSSTLRSKLRIGHFEDRSRLEKIHLILCESQGNLIFGGYLI